MQRLIIPSSSTSFITATAVETTDELNTFPQETFNSFMLISPRLVHRDTFIVVNQSNRFPIQPFIPYTVKEKLESLQILKKTINATLTNVSLNSFTTSWTFLAWNSCDETTPFYSQPKIEKLRFKIDNSSVVLKLKDWFLDELIVSHINTGGSLNIGWKIETYDDTSSIITGNTYYLTGRTGYADGVSIKIKDVDSLEIRDIAVEGSVGASEWLTLILKRF